MHVQIQMPEEAEQAVEQQAAEQAPDEGGEEQMPIDFSHVGRNDPCPCGSGKRFKNCHGKLK
ncbi:MAG TPA: hypothetical protein DCZ56_05940 [Sutterella sp.]|nr:hypothetical protein [Sutterella sp.]